MKLTMAVAAGCTGITPFLIVSSSHSASPSVSVQKVSRSSTLRNRPHVCCAGHVRNDRMADRVLVRSSAAPGKDGCSLEAESENSLSSGHAQVSSPSFPVVVRRQLMGKAVTLLMASVAFPAIAAPENGTGDDFMLYQDDTDKYSLLVPQEWVKGEGNTTEKKKNNQRKITAFYPENDTSANVNILITGLAADYTSLGSFGTADMFAETLVNSLDRAWQKPPGQKARLIDDSSKNGMYYIEYTVQKPGEAQRHLLSVVGIANNGWYNRLYTVTAQYFEEDSEKYQARLKKIVSSFKLTG